MDLKLDERNTKLMLHIRNGKEEGETAFFRNRYLFNTVLEIMSQRPQKKFLILFHACSIGAEVYSFVIHYFLQQLHLLFDIEVLATDINKTFLTLAKQGFYPDHIFKGMSEEEISFFQFSDQRFVTPIEMIRNKIKFLDPVSFVDFKSNLYVDVVFVLNALAFVTEKQQTTAIQQIAKYNSFLLCVSDFHTQNIKKDLQSVGYIPVTNNIERIHNAWNERIFDSHDSDKNLSSFAKISDYQYKLCSIFKKKIFHP